MGLGECWRIFGGTIGGEEPGKLAELSGVYIGLDDLLDERVVLNAEQVKRQVLKDHHGDLRQQKQYQRREVDAAQVGHDAPDGVEQGGGDGMEHGHDGCQRIDPRQDGLDQGEPQDQVEGPF